MFREKTQEYLVLSSSYICCCTHSSSALPTRFSPLLLEFKHNLHRPRGLMALQKQWQHKTRAHFTSLHPPRNPDRSFVRSGFILADCARRVCSGLCGVSSGQSPCVLQAGTAHGSSVKGLFWGCSQPVGNASGREAHCNAKQRRRMGNDSCPRGLQEEYPVSAEMQK